eukprot:UN25586
MGFTSSSFVSFYCGLTFHHFGIALIHYGLDMDDPDGAFGASMTELVDRKRWLLSCGFFNHCGRCCSIHVYGR